MSNHQNQICEKIGTEESQIDVSIELTEKINKFIHYSLVI